MWSGLARYDVQLRAPGSRRYVRLPTSITQLRLIIQASFPGTYRMRARGADSRGRVGRWSYATTIVPEDLGAVGRAGWRGVADAQAYAGTLVRASTPGARLRLRFRGSRASLVGRAGPDGGRMVIRVDQGPARVVDTASPAIRDRALLAVVRAPAGREHELSVTTLAGAPGRASTISIDAVGILGGDS
jgi:hypothetical protein